MGSLFKALHKPAPARGNGRMTWKIWLGPAPRVFFHGTVDLAAFKKWYSDPTGRDPSDTNRIDAALSKGSPWAGRGAIDVIKRLKSHGGNQKQEVVQHAGNRI